MHQWAGVGVLVPFFLQPLPFFKEVTMRVKGIRVVASEQEIAMTISRHTGKNMADSMEISKKILNGVPVEFDDDWALEQDLKDLGIKF